jgi:hypothetical protein
MFCPRAAGRRPVGSRTPGHPPGRLLILGRRAGPDTFWFEARSLQAPKGRMFGTFESRRMGPRARDCCPSGNAAVSGHRTGLERQAPLVPEADCVMLGTRGRGRTSDEREGKQRRCS